MAARIVEDEAASGYVEQVDDLMAKAAKAKKYENYVMAIGREFDASLSYSANGFRIITLLIQHGWTPPEGLF